MEKPLPLSKLIDLLNPLEISGYKEVPITHVTNDSRMCRSGSLFFAFEGLHVDGHSFIGEAVNRGCAAVVHTKKLARSYDEVPLLRIDDPYRRLSEAADMVYHSPSRSIPVLGITGTDGKSSTCYLLYQLLVQIGKKPALISSVYCDIGSGLSLNSAHVTTPDAPVVQAMIKDSYAHRCDCVILESSSHGLSDELCRLKDIDFSAAICTGISSDHLDFHKTRERYIDAKMNLFRQLKPGGAAILPVQQEWAKRVHSVLNENQKILTWSVDTTPAEISIRSVKGTKYGMSLEMQWSGTLETISLPFQFQTEIRNLLPALLAVQSLYPGEKDPFRFNFMNLKPLRGRYTRRTLKNNAHVIIDFAHTPDAFLRLFQESRSLFPDRHFTAIFGSAGDRDKGKRPLLGEAASRYCKKLVLTEEDPRSEKNESIFSDILQGVGDDFPGIIITEPERRKAIELTLEQAEPDELIFLLGKGHENSIERAELSIPWDEELEFNAAADKLTTQGEYMHTSEESIILIYGGKSREHEVSCISAASLRASLKDSGFKTLCIGIAQDNRWYLQREIVQNYDPRFGAEALQIIEERQNLITIIPGAGFSTLNGETIIDTGVIFPITHGSYGEDGRLQSLLEFLPLPYIGCDSFSSLLGFSKYSAKLYWKEAGLPLLPYLFTTKDEISSEEGLKKVSQSVTEALGFPVIVKPENSGSSIGITKAFRAEELTCSLLAAASESDRIVIEKAISCRELECSVYTDGNELFVSEPGEVITPENFYDFAHKYEEGRLSVSIALRADISRSLAEELDDLSRKAFTTLFCTGLARVDFLLDTESGKVYLNEINTLPGFTETSMYLQLVKESGTQFQALIDCLIRSARMQLTTREQEHDG